jgi:hypothetical protein
LIFKSTLSQTKNSCAAWAAGRKQPDAQRLALGQLTKN